MGLAAATSCGMRVLGEGVRGTEIRVGAPSCAVAEVKTGGRDWGARRAGGRRLTFRGRLKTKSGAPGTGQKAGPTRRNTGSSEPRGKVTVRRVGSGDGPRAVWGRGWEDWPWLWGVSREPPLGLRVLGRGVWLMQQDSCQRGSGGAERRARPGWRALAWREERAALDGVCRGARSPRTVLFSPSEGRTEGPKGGAPVGRC